MRKLALIILLLASPAVAQQAQPDVTILQRIIPSLQAQRNEALDKAVLAEARAAQLAEEVQKLRAELEKSKEPKPKE